MQNKELIAHRPQIIQGEIEVLPFRKNDDTQEAIEVLSEGHYVLILDFYSTGLALLNDLKSYLRSPQKTNFIEERSARTIFRELSHRILLEVSHHRLRVKKAPQVGWLKILYPDQEEFALSFPEIQGLNSAWQWYEKGIHIPVLKEKIHPWYGSYFPTRFEHLELFEDYLNKYMGPKESAFDVGVGSGVLSLQLQKHGFKSISASDNNPNAIIGMKEELSKKQISNINLLYGEFFVDSEELQELIVFNPPWLPGSGNIQKLDTAIYYEQELFTEFFKQASQKIKPDGRVALLFSNLAQITHPNSKHPIEEELAHGKRFEKVELLKKPVAKASTKTNRDLSRRSDEWVELWVLKRRVTVDG